MNLLDGKNITLGTCYYPEHWDKSIWEEDLIRMLNTGIKVVRIGEFAWNVVEPEEGVYTFDFFDEFLDLAESKGMKVIFCTPTATPPAWLTDQYPEVLNSTIEGTLFRHGARRHYNYNSLIYRKYSANIAEKFAGHFGKHKSIIGWQIDNELNCEVDVFYSESDTIAFREFLKNKYFTLDELNRAWGTVFWNQTYTHWKEVHVPRKTINNNAVNPHQALDYFRFVSESARSFTKMQSDIIRKYKKNDDFITTNGIFGNLDNHELTRESLDFMTYDSYPNFSYLIDSYNKNDNLKDRHWSGNLSEVRSMSEPFGIMEQQSGANGWTAWMGAPTPRPGQIALWTMQSIAHGADFISYFRWRTATVGTEIYWHGILDYSGRDNRRLKEVGEIYNNLQKLQEISGGKYQANVAIIKDYDNIFDTRVDVWHDRIERKSQRGLLEAHQFTHTPFNYIYLQDEMDASELFGYKVIFYPHGMILNEKRVNILKEYVKQGGTLVMGCRTGLKDMNGHCVMDRLPGEASELTGTDVVEYSIVGPDEENITIEWDGIKLEADLFNDILKPIGENAKSVGTYSNSYYKGETGLVKNKFGKGTVYYFGGTFSAQTGKAFLEKLGVCSPYSADLLLPESCEIAIRKKDGIEYIIILNYSKDNCKIRIYKEMIDMYSEEKVIGDIEIAGFGTMVLKNK